MLGADATPVDFERLGIHVRALDRSPTDDDLRAALARNVAGLAPDLVLLGTSARTGFDRLRRGSVAEDVARDLHPASLFVPYSARGLVHPATGHLHLRRVLVPVTSRVPQQPVIDELYRWMSLVAPGPVAFRLRWPPAATTASSTRSRAR